MWWRRMAVLMAGLALTAPAAAGEDGGDAARGRKLAEQVCGRCHAWDPADPYNSIDSTPSFQWMAKKLDFYRERILSVTDRLPHIAQRLEVDAADLEDILAYVATLAPQPQQGPAAEEEEEDDTTRRLREYLRKLRQGGD